MRYRYLVCAFCLVWTCGHPDVLLTLPLNLIALTIPICCDIDHLRSTINHIKFTFVESIHVDCGHRTFYIKTLTSNNQHLAGWMVYCIVVYIISCPSLFQFEERLTYFCIPARINFIMGVKELESKRRMSSFLIADLLDKSVTAGRVNIL